MEYQLVAIAVIVAVLCAPYAFTGNSSTSRVLEAPAALPIPPPNPEPYQESIVDLPGFSPLHGFVYGSNCLPSPGGGCFLGGSNYSQVPVLANSPEQPFGIYYVNNDSQLAVTDPISGQSWTVAPITRLYQTFGQYGGMLPNEFTLPDGYDEALFFGTLTPNGTTVAVETVNLTTAQVTLFNTSIALASVNQQPIMVSPTVVLVFSGDSGPCADCDAQVSEVNMRTRAASLLTTVPFFEANNIYWIPQEQQFINVEAHGSLGDRVEQWDWSPSLSRLTLATTVRFTTGIPVNWVNGIAYNASTHSLAFSAGNATLEGTFQLVYSPNGSLSATVGRRWSSTEILFAQEYAYTGSWVMGPFVNHDQYLVDPWTGATVTTTLPFTNLSRFNVCDGACFLGTYASSPAYRIDFHASVLLGDPFYRVVFAQY